MKNYWDEVVSLRFRYLGDCDKLESYDYNDDIVLDRFGSFEHLSLYIDMQCLHGRLYRSLRTDSVNDCLDEMYAAPRSGFITRFGCSDWLKAHLDYFYRR